MADTNTNFISKITLFDGSVWEIKDAESREKIEALQNYTASGVTYAGTTTTELTDGATTSPITVGTESVTPVAGTMVNYNNIMFAWNGSQWDQLGSAGAIKSLAYKDSASGDITPAGEVTQPTFEGETKTITSTGTPKGSVTISKGDGTANYTPEGSVGTPTITVTPNTTTVNSITGVGTLPTCTLPKMTATVANENLTLGWTDGSFNAGTLPTKGEDTTVATGIKSAVSTQPSFTGTPVDLEAGFKGETLTVTSESYTPSGTVTKPEFKGTKATVTVS